MDDAVGQATLNLYLAHWRDYVGAPMLPPLYGAWAARAGDRRLALKLLDEGYGAYQMGRFQQTTEYRLDKVDGVASGPFFANMGGFLLGLLLGFPGLDLHGADPAAWARRHVVLPTGWREIRCGRLWIQGQEAALSACHGDHRATLSLPSGDGAADGAPGTAEGQ